ncbi:hypothetical protein QJS10_CPB12g00454 [Acorus calamus]|uniref:Uncharacterized protein n=1 Tax=Acorus calamus TaxID=4465 RepID=A0AAV9DKG2_ACOCL|nr:hypothetical protein QJS10_CPB12g00454 [Acorus calamus]
MVRIGITDRWSPHTLCAMSGLVFLVLVKPHPHSPPKRRKRRISSTRAQRVSVLRLFDPALKEEEDLVILDLLNPHPPLPLEAPEATRPPTAPPARSRQPSPLLKHRKPLQGDK